MKSLALNATRTAHDAWHLEHSYQCAASGNDAKASATYQECEHTCAICTHYEYCDRSACDVVDCTR